MRPLGEEGAIPDGWQVVRLGDVAEVVTGNTPSREVAEYYGGVVPWVKPSDLSSGRLIDSSEEYLTEAGVAVSRQVPEYSVLVSCIGTIGEVAISRVPLCFNQQINALLPSDAVLSAFLFWACDRLGKYFLSMSAKTAVPILNKTAFSDVRFCLPPLPEQRAIATVLDSIDEAIAGTDAVIAATEQMRDALLHELLTRGVPGWHTEWKDAPGLGTIPVDWEVVRLWDVAEVKSGVGFPLDRQGRRDGAYPFIKVSDMTLEGNETFIWSANNYVDLEDVKELGAEVFAPGAIVFPKVGAAIATNKKRLLTVPTIIDNNMAGVTVADASRCNGRFLHFWFESIDLFQFANVSAVPSITGSRLKRALIPLPALSEQTTIVASLNSTYQTIERAREERDGLRMLKASVADALLSGRVRVGV